MRQSCVLRTPARSVWGEQTDVNSYCRFLQEFDYVGEQACQLHIRADSNYTVWINGSYVGAFQYPDYPQYRVFDSYDVTRFLRQGRNVVAVLGYCLNQSSSVYRKGRPSVQFWIDSEDELLCASGKKTLCRVSESYLSGPACEKFSGQLSFGFEYDATREDGWLHPDYHMSREWRHCVVEETEEILNPRPIAQVEELPPAPARIVAQGAFEQDASIASRALRMQKAYLSAARVFEVFDTEPQPGAAVSMPSQEGIRMRAEYTSAYIVIDLGKETAGWLCLDIDADHGTQIDIGFGEHLQDLRVRSYVGGRCFAVGYTATQGRQRFVHRMKRIGCRYLQLHVHGRVKLYYAGLIPTQYPVTETGVLQLGDRLHQRIYRTCLDTLRLCMHEHYEDCPWREQALYAMDSHHQMLYGYYAFGEKTFAQSSLRLLALGQREDGLLELCAPAEVAITIPSFSLHFVIAVWENLLFCGDRRFVEEMLPVMRRILEAFEERVEECGLVRRFKGKQYWNFYEWSDGLSGTLNAEDPENVFDLPLNALYAMALNAACLTERELGNIEWSCRYRQQREGILEAVNRVFWDRAARLYCTCWDGQRTYGFAELSQALAVCCGAADEAKRPHVLAALAERNGALTPVTLACSIYRYDALMTEAERYSRRVFDEVADVWGEMLFAGATSFWETQKGADDFDDAGSLCHGWSAVPVYLYYRYGLGMWPACAGFAGYQFTPADCGFTVAGELVSGNRRFIVSPDTKGGQQVKMIQKR